MSEGGMQRIEMQENQWDDTFRSARNLLQQGDDTGAIALLESLVKDKPTDRVVRTLLAMAYSRCDQWNQAEKYYRALIADFPEEILLRVRLATLYMQLERDTEARDLLEAAADTHPTSKELHSTLGVIYMRLGDYAKAHNTFQNLGDAALIKALETKMKEEGVVLHDLEIDTPEPLRPDAKTVSFPSQPGFRSVQPEHDMDHPHFRHDVDEIIEPTQEDEPPWGSLALSDLSENNIFHELSLDHDLPDEVSQELDESVEGAIPVVVLPPQTASEQTNPFFRSSAHLREDFPFILSPAELTTNSQTEFANPPGPELKLGETNTPMWLDFSSLFEENKREFLLLHDGRLLIRVRDKVFVRLRDVVMLIGEPAKHLEHKRFQGKPMGQVFGPKDNPIYRLEGDCRILLQAQEQGHRSSVLLTSGQVSYFREGTVLAFSKTLDWENGRVPADIKDVEDLSLDQFWGQGELILQSSGPIWGIPVRPGFPLRVAYERLVGWVGELVPQIRPTSSVAESASSKAFVEFDGEGGVLLSS